VNEVFALSLTAALNPTLLTATTVMLLLDDPKRLMLGYWLGAMLTSVTCGLVIVFALQESGAASTTQRTISPLADIALGTLALAAAFVLGTGRDKSVRERRAKRREGKEQPRWQRTLNQGTPRAAFIIGVALTLPGASYIAAMTRLSKLDYDTPVTILAVLGVNLVMMILLEAPLIAFAVAPGKTVERIERAKRWIAARGRHYAVRGLVLVGVALVLTGVVELLA